MEQVQGQHGLLKNLSQPSTQEIIANALKVDVYHQKPDLDWGSKSQENVYRMFPHVYLELFVVIYIHSTENIYVHGNYKI